MIFELAFKESKERVTFMDKTFLFISNMFGWIVAIMIIIKPAADIMLVTSVGQMNFKM